MNSLLVTTLATTSSSNTVEAPSALGSFASMIGGLVVVVMIILVLAYLVRRFNLTPASNGVMKTLAVTPVGQKEKLVLMEMDGKQYLLGVTQHQITLLDKIKDPIEVKAESFAEKLRQAKGRKEDAPN
ncbi:flagellar biosynthetic protein FliO [Parashewanella curva]|uniref:Flagellar protein n=1 Tax=Parashewanella curva TaxID=2338552 RepID=A0A3L8Q392_9GAMM|nr:flagellar biosynthetic protein FliO [Parashewanella curva]RLV61628.1 flagellar biosynthetic protein FliO [Parashewanella curva]